jgi:RNA polymerase sigma-70 factor (ECF subfamily)
MEGLQEGIFMMAWRHSPGRGMSDHTDLPVSFGQQLDRAKHGEQEAMSALYRQFLPGVFGYIAARVPDRTTAEDLTSEVFLRMVEGISRLRTTEEAGFAAWLLRIARISVAGYYRKRERQPAVLSLSTSAAVDAGEEKTFLFLASASPAGDPEYQTEMREEWGNVVKAINALTEEQRQVLVCRLLLGYEIETVARMLGKKGNAVKALQFRALQSLHRLLGTQGVARQPPPSQLRRPEGAS